VEEVTAMQTTTLGRTGLTVSVAGLGCGGASRLGTSQGKSREHAVALVRAALDRGVTLIDTAMVYGTEEIVGEAARGRRDRLVISTKFPIAAGAHADLADMIGADALEAGVDGCLTRLGIDCIDIMHLHAVAPQQYAYARDVLLPRLRRLQEKGKIRFTGLTERFITDTTHEMAEQAVGDGLFDVLMIGLNYVNQTALKTVLPAAARNGQGTLCMFAVRGPLARRETAEALVQRLVDKGEIDPADLDPADPLGFLTAPGVAASLTEAAYRFCRHASGMQVTVTGTGDLVHLAANLDAINGGPLPKAVLEKLRTIFGDVTSESGEPWARAS
jgi:L-galactose dehydrogenase